MTQKEIKEQLVCIVITGLASQYAEHYDQLDEEEKKKVLSSCRKDIESDEEMNSFFESIIKTTLPFYEDSLKYRNFEREIEGSVSKKTLDFIPFQL